MEVICFGFGVLVIHESMTAEVLENFIDLVLDDGSWTSDRMFRISEGIFVRMRDLIACFHLLYPDKGIIWRGAWVVNDVLDGINCDRCGF